MANLFTRIVKAVKTEINQTFEENDINPSELFNDFLKTCEIEIAKIEALIKRQDQIATRFHKERDDAFALGKKRRRQAEVAAKAGEGELEKRALNDAEYYEELGKSLEAKCQKAQEDLDKLRENLNETKKKIKEVNIHQLEQISKDNFALISKRLKDAYDKYTQPIADKAKADDLDDIIEDLEQKAADDLDEKILLLEKSDD